MRFILLATVALSHLVACVPAPVGENPHGIIVMQHPETKQAVSCDGAGATNSGGLIGEAARQRVINACVVQYEAAGFRPVDAQPTFN